MLNFKQRGQELIVAMLSLFALSSCSGGDSEPSPTPQPPPTQVVQPVTVSIDSNQLDGSTNSTFNLSLNTESQSPISAISWSTSDGQSGAATTFNVNFPTSGVYSVVVEVTNDSGGVASDELDLVVHDTARLAPPGISIPAVFTDLDSSGDSNLADLVIAVQAKRNLVPLSGVETLTADLNLNGQLDSQDLSLISEAVFDQDVLPTLVYSDQPIRSFTSVTLVAPELLDPNQSFQLSINGNNIAVQQRTILGYIKFLVPKVLSGSSRLQVRGSNGANFEVDLNIEAAPTTPNDPGEMLTEYISLLRTLQPQSAANYRSFYGEDSNFAEAVSEAQIESIAAFEVIAENLALSENAEAETLMLELLMANGLGDRLAELRELDSAVQSLKSKGFSSAEIASLSQNKNGVDICSVVDDVCRLRSFNESYGAAIEVLDFVCIFSALASSVFSGPIGPAIIGGGCLTIQAGVMTNEIAKGLTDPLSFDLRISATEIDPGASYSLETLIVVDDSRLLCASLQSNIGEKVDDEISDVVGDVLEGVLKRKLRTQKIQKILDRLNIDSLQVIEDIIQDVSKFVLEQTSITEGATKVIRDICTPFDVSGSQLSARANPESLISFDSSRGNLTVNADLTATFQCTPPQTPTSSSSVELVAIKELCSGAKRTNVRRTTVLPCAEVRNVTVTFGDNGSANDDIFAVTIAGEQFTSSTPQRSVSGTVQVPSQSELDVTMRGLAAPDGIGTYFIRFDGATIISGDATSGRDLTPGVVKNFQIRVN